MQTRKPPRLGDQGLENKMANHKLFTVLLSDGTTGVIDTDSLDGQSPDAFIGEVVRIKAKDENGMPFEAEGVLAEVLE